MADAEPRESNAGQKVVNLVITTEESWTDRQGARQHRTERHRLVFWARAAEVVADVRKGDRLLIEGKLQTREWTDHEERKRETTEVNVTRVTIIDRHV
jgi:single-strand DNA-binding protein